ncbi:hypothetical protein MYCTH_2302812 [Thermothelomyces thermophilus ATCC 42464]|uniref:Essential protein Yae1 N-terminal domain-containing protein n=1 Tax=Thermothelomyces thermophilus (strain ATCC 42464 / BCRC 31852 / DSM 1799) TaxID=573729 RepID=G2Q8L6_THET4|nr:uncharacterized protein MYCTH_2302812 [Thermothelomyces thermophilus ATCC 42464]AEO57065.1 hypothetical protein MYCTH_2302812 [Thermothelomyces thermophilus ATCC 42464]
MATTSAQPSSQPPPPSSSGDPFDTLLTLEDQFYTEGYNQGMADGLVAGRTEGRQLGLERGFQKFVEAGRMQGRAIVWANRLRLGRGHGRGQGAHHGAVGSANPAEEAGAGGAQARDGAAGEGDRGGVGRGSGGGGDREEEEKKNNGEGTAPPPAAELSLPPLPDNPRLRKHVTTLYALAETESLSTENTDEAVDDFDDRLRRAQGRFKVIERMTGEGDSAKSKGTDGHGHDPGSRAGKGEGTTDI